MALHRNSKDCFGLRPIILSDGIKKKTYWLIRKQKSECTCGWNRNGSWYVKRDCPKKGHVNIARPCRDLSSSFACRRCSPDPVASNCVHPLQYDRELRGTCGTENGESPCNYGPCSWCRRLGSDIRREPGIVTGIAVSTTQPSNQEKSSSGLGSYLMHVMHFKRLDVICAYESFMRSARK